MALETKYWTSDRQKCGIYKEIRGDKLIYADFSDVIFRQHPIYTMSGYNNIIWKEVSPDEIKMLRKKEMTQEEFLNRYWG